MARKLFCQLSPFCYRISVEKEIMLRNLRDLISPVRFAEHREEEPLPALIKGHRSPMLRQLAGVDMQLQYNKETNLRLAGERIHGLIIEPGQTFSFWHTVGRTTARKGYLPGLTIGAGRLGQRPAGDYVSWPISSTGWFSIALLQSQSCTITPMPFSRIAGGGCLSAPGQASFIKMLIIASAMILTLRFSCLFGRRSTISAVNCGPSMLFHTAGVL